MAMIRMLAKLAGNFPPVELKGKSVKDMRMLRLGVEPARYVGMALSISCIMGVAGLLTASILKAGTIPAIGAFALLFVAAFAFLLSLPGMELRKRTEEIESAMPFFLRSLGMLLDMGIPFQRAMEIASETDRTLGAEISVVLKDMADGMSLQRALASFALSFNSLAVKRTVSQLISAYETGGSGSEMKKIGDELLALEQHKLKEYSAKSAMFGLVFIITSAVLPTFFLVYSIAGRFGLGTRITESQTAIAMLVVFPMLSVLILLMSRAVMPRSAFSEERGFDLKLLLPGVIFILGFLVFPRFQLLALIAGAALGVWMAWTNQKAEKKDEEIDGNLPDALFAVSGMPKSTRPERIFRMVEEGGFGELSVEFGKSRKQLEMNVTIGAVLDDLWRRNRSAMLRRACLMMKQMVDTNALNRLSSLGEDMIRSFQIKRERGQLFAMQKYTLIFGAVLVPLILKITLHLMDGMGSLMGDGAAGLSGSTAATAALVPPYLVLYSIIAAGAIADAEGKPSAAAAYSIGLAGVGLAAFQFINL